MVFRSIKLSKQHPLEVPTFCGEPTQKKIIFNSFLFPRATLIVCWQEGSGTLSKIQFESILRAALPYDETLYKEEVEEFWEHFTKREDGDIENRDLVNWILKPSTPLMLTESGDLAFFDLKAALHPLFQVWETKMVLRLFRRSCFLIELRKFCWPKTNFPEVYNQNGDGYICLQEFMDAHGILQIALRTNPSEDDDPPVLRGDLQNCFAHVGDSDAKPQIARKCGMCWQISCRKRLEKG